jgi:hypothetical protein
MKERTVYLIKAKWRGAYGEIEIYQNEIGLTAIKIPFLSIDPFTFDEEEVSNLIICLGLMHKS